MQLRGFRRLPAFCLLLSLGCGSAGQKLASQPEPRALVRAQNSDFHSVPRIPAEQFFQLPATQQPGLIVHPLLLRDALLLGLRQSPVIRVLNGEVVLSPTTRLDPQIASWEIQRQEGQFAPVLEADFEGAQIDQPPDSFFGPGIQTDTRRDYADYGASLRKPWATGTELTLAYDPPLGYLYFPNSTDDFNPSYASDVVWKVRQKLLKGGNLDSNLGPIRIAQLKTNQSEVSVRQATNQQIRSIKQAYWRLQAAYQVWTALDQVRALTAESVRIEELRYQAQQVTYADVARAKIGHQSLLQEWLAAKSMVAQRELQLKNLIGLPANERARLIPVDPLPESWPFMNWDSVVGNALASNPGLRQQRLEIDILSQQLLQAENDLLPELDVNGSYRVSGLQTKYDEAFEQMSTFDYTDWTVGVTFSYPLGNPSAKAAKSGKELQLVRERAVLTEQEQQLIYKLRTIQEQLTLAWDRYHSAKRKVELSRQWMRVARLRYLQPLQQSSSENWLLVALADYQSAMKAHLAAVDESSEYLAEFNILLARLTEEQGAGLQEWEIHFAQPPIPPEVLKTWAELGFGHVRLE